jgi:Zn-dependent protease
VRSKVRQSLISLAGPATNVVFALLLAVPFLLGAGGGITGFRDGAGGIMLTGDHAYFWSALALLAFLQVTAAVLNLLPVPGLDGGNLVFPWLNDQWKRAFNLIAPYGFILLFALLWQPEINRFFFTALYAAASAIGIPDLLAQVGFVLMKFWS